MVFAEVERRARAHLQTDRSVILDATHYQRRYRTYAIDLARQLHVPCIAVWFDTPLAEALQRNGWRIGDRFGEQRVPDYIIRDMAAHEWGTVSGAGLEVERFLILRGRMFVSRVRETNSLQREIHNGLAHVCQTVDS